MELADAILALSIEGKEVALAMNVREGRIRTPEIIVAFAELNRYRQKPFSPISASTD